MIRLHDVQGRAVLEQHALVETTSRLTVELDLDAVAAPLARGVYFAQAVDAAGNYSGAIRLVVLR